MKKADIGIKMEPGCLVRPADHAQGADRQSFVLPVLSTVLGIFHAVMKTATLGVVQWLICTAVALSVVVVAEIR